MKQIVIIFLSIMFFSTTAMAEYFEYTVSAKTEKLVLEKVEQTIPQILSGKIRSVFHGSNCWPNNERTISVKSVHIDKAYTVDTQGKLSPYYTGLIHYHHNSCRNND